MEKNSEQVFDKSGQSEKKRQHKDLQRDKNLRYGKRNKKVRKNIEKGGMRENQLQTLSKNSTLDSKPFLSTSFEDSKSNQL